MYHHTNSFITDILHAIWQTQVFADPQCSLNIIELREKWKPIHYPLSCSVQPQRSGGSLRASCRRRSWRNSTWASGAAAASAGKPWRPRQRETPPGPPGCSGCCETSTYCILPCSKSQRPPSQCYHQFRSAGIFEMSHINKIPALHSINYAGKSAENSQNFA